MFESVLIANRGEIAVRIAATLRRIGVRSVGVFTPADAGSRHVRAVDVAVPLPSNDSYLDPDAIVAAALATGAQAVHPGYGFLAENPSLARACEDAGHALSFVGPSAEVIELMGNKVAARAAAVAAGLPVLPGRSEPGLSDDDLRSAALELDFPLMIKPTAGGGGIGMHVVGSAGDLDAALSLARSEAAAAFGDDALFLERHLDRARHVEVQVLADRSGNVLHLGERECTLQRRHQKVIEEAPAPGLAPEERAAMCDSAVRLASSCGYVGAGTVELILQGDGAGWFFLEMNTRLQVEHRVTELVWGLDLVEQQLRIAVGESIGAVQQGLRPFGHAVEARLYAEDPARGFLPTGGTVITARLPCGTDGGRSTSARHRGVVPRPEGRLGPEPQSAATEPVVVVDSAVEPGDRVGSEYDPLLAKVVVWAPQRESALARLEGELAGSALLGVVTNQELVLAVLRRPQVHSGAGLDTRLVERVALEASEARDEEDEAALVAAALALHLAGRPAGNDPWDDAGGWRVGDAAWTRAILRGTVRGETQLGWRGDVRGGAFSGEVQVGTGPVRPASAALSGEPDRGALLTLIFDGLSSRYDVAVTAERVWVARDGTTTVLGLGARAGIDGAAGRSRDGVVRSPMPGVVRRVEVAVGVTVRRGDLLAVVEAMKMQHPINAPLDGVVLEVRAGAGSRVELDEVLAVVGDGDARMEDR